MIIVNDNKHKTKENQVTATSQESVSESSKQGQKREVKVKRIKISWVA